MQYNGYKPGYIYVLKSGPYYKIGYADVVEQRLKTVGSSTKPDDLTEPIELLFSFSTTSKRIAERTLHDFFKRHRVKGEWFKFTDRHIEVLRVFVTTSVDEFVLKLHGLPDDVTLYTREDIEFCKTFGMLIVENNESVPVEELEAYIEHERMRRSRKQRAERYRKNLMSMIEYLPVEDLEWLYRAVIERGTRFEDDAA